MTVPRILIIAGSDSGGGAGIQADIKTVTMLGGHAMTAVTALTAQNTVAVEEVMPVPTSMVLKQIDAVAIDIGVDAVKIGMIGSSETVHAVAEWLERQEGLPVVFDPVMVASSGAALADRDTIDAFHRLSALCRVATPNAPELAALTSLPVETVEQLQQAALALARRSGAAVLAKGGHLSGDVVHDLLAEPNGHLRHWQGARIETRHSHGTGCTLASAIACKLGAGASLGDAIGHARAYVVAAMKAAPGLGQGHGPMGHALGVSPYDSIHNLLADG